MDDIEPLDAGQETMRSEAIGTHRDHYNVKDKESNEYLLQVYLAIVNENNEDL